MPAGPLREREVGLARAGSAEGRPRCLPWAGIGEGRPRCPLPPPPSLPSAGRLLLPPAAPPRRDGFSSPRLPVLSGAASPPSLGEEASPRCPRPPVLSGPGPGAVGSLSGQRGGSGSPDPVGAVAVRGLARRRREGRF